MNTIPKKLSEQELQSLVAVWAKASEAYNACFGYFNDLHEAFDARGDDWSKHIHEVIFAGKDGVYNDLKKIEDDTLKQAQDFTEVMAVEYPYLSDFSSYVGNGCGSEKIREIVQREWKDATLDVLHAEFKKETDKFSDIFLGCKNKFPLSCVVQGSSVYFTSGEDQGGPFLIESKSPSGRRFEMRNWVTGEEKIMKNVGKKTCLLIPEDRVAGLTDLNKRWTAALQEVGIIKGA